MCCYKLELVPVIKCIDVFIYILRCIVYGILVYGFAVEYDQKEFGQVVRVLFCNLPQGGVDLSLAQY